MGVEPLFLKSVFHEKLWGGAHLREFGYDLPSDKVGEYWAISAHPHGPSTVSNGEFAGQTLDKLYETHRELFGGRKEKVFPLLTKILDANDWLSVQVHPDDAYALEHEGELGKTECWYILSAEPDSQIIYGHQARTHEELAAMVEAEDWEGLLRKVPVKAGDFFYVPSGTMHAIGSGIMILETQQSSDTTYRVYDFDRQDQEGHLRDLHIRQSLDVLTIPGDKLPSNDTETVNFPGLELTSLVESPFFSVYKWTFTGAHDFTKEADYTLLSIIAGTGLLMVDGEEYPLSKGDHLILPSTVENWRIDGELSIIASAPAASAQ